MLTAGIVLRDDPTVLSFLGVDAFPDPYSYMGTVNFADTVNLIGVTVTDSSGNPISGATITSLSGFDYAGVPEPHPMPVLVLLTAVSVCTFVRLRKV